VVVIARVEYKVAYPDTPIVVRQRVLYCCQCRVTRTERADLRFLNDFKKMWSSRSPSATDQRTVCNLYTRVRLRNRAVRVCATVLSNCAVCLLVQFKACSSLRRPWPRIKATVSGAHRVQNRSSNTGRARAVQRSFPAHKLSWTDLRKLVDPVTQSVSWSRPMLRIDWLQTLQRN